MKKEELLTHGNRKSAAKLRYAGRTLQEIADMYGCTREYVRIAIKRYLTYVMDINPEEIVYQNLHKWMVNNDCPVEKLTQMLAKYPYEIVCEVVNGKIEPDAEFASLVSKITKMEPKEVFKIERKTKHGLSDNMIHTSVLDKLVELTTEDKKSATELRNAGWTLQEIADWYNCTPECAKRSICQVLNTTVNKIPGSTSDNIKYRGLFAWMVKFNLSIADLVLMLDKYSYKTVYDYICGEAEPRLNFIIDVLRITKMTFEDVFINET